MSILTGPEIVAAVSRGDVAITPFRPEHVGPNSVDVHLADELFQYAIPWRHPLDPRVETPLAAVPKAPHRRQVTRGEIDLGWLLEPGTLYLGRTVERTHTPKHVPLIGGRSSTGRLGISIHVTAGFGDVGFDGCWTLEIHVVQPVIVFPNMRIGQLWLFDTVGDLVQYAGRYQGSTGTVGHRYARG